MDSRFAIHTDAPVMPLTRMFGETAHIEIARAMRGGPDCFYAWREPQTTRECRPHHIVTGLDDHDTAWVAKTLITLGHQVVVTQPTLFTEPTGDHHEVEGMPQRYLAEHTH